MTTVKAFDFVPTYNAKYFFTEEDNVFVSTSQQYEIGMRIVELNRIAIGIDFEGTTIHEEVAFTHIENEMRVAMTVIAHAMLAVLTGVLDAKDRDNYLRDLFTLVRQVNVNLKNEEVTELLSRIKEPHDGVDYGIDGIYWNAGNFIRYACGDEQPRVQFTNGEMVFIARPHFGGHQIEFLAMAFEGEVSVQARTFIGWTMEYEERLDDMLTKFRDSVVKLGWKLM